MLTLGAAEAVLRVAGFAPTFTEQRLLVKLDARALYRVLPGTRDDLNSAGFRDREFVRAKSGRKRILMVGDSFLMGLNVPPHQVLPVRLQERIGDGFEVYNMGVLGYGPDQALVRLLDEGLDLDPDIVVLGLFPANDFADLYENQLFTVDANGRLAPHPDNPVQTVLRTPRLAMLARRALTGEFFREGEQDEIVERLFGDGYDLLRDVDSPESLQKIAIMRAVLREFQGALEQRGIPFWVLVIPSYENIQNDANFRRKGIPREEYFRNEELVMGLCGELGIRCIDLSAAFRQHRLAGLYSNFDRHMSPTGLELSARVLGRSMGLIAPDEGAR